MAGYIYKSITASLHFLYGGTYRIRGTLTRDGAPLKGPVWLYTYTNGKLLRQTNSAATDGSFCFVGVAYLYQGYFLLSHDPITPSKNAAIADLITPEPMP